MFKVTLVFPRFKYPSGDFPLGLAYIAAYLKHSVKDVKIDMIDTTFNPSMDYVILRIKDIKPDIVGIYTATLMYEDALKVAQVAKTHSAFVVVGGPHATVMPDTLINNESVDSVCIGEGEETLSDLVQEFYGDRKFDRIHGIWYKKNGGIVKNESRKPINDMDSLPFPANDIFDVETYIDNFVQLDSYSPNLRGMSTIVSRGCLYRCSYCQPTLAKIFGKKFRIRSPENSIKELKLLKERYRLDCFYFQDDTLTAFKDWIMRFSELAVKENLGLLWACNTRAELIDEEMITAMKKAGLVKLKVGIESISDRIRNGIYRKGVSVSQINRLIEIANDYCIQIAGFFMLGAPTETEKEIRETIKFSVRSDLKEANFSVTVPLPGTGLYELAKKENWKLPESFSEYDYYHATRPPIANDDISSRKLELYKKMAYLVFYLHPKRLIHTLKTVFGFRKFKKTIQKLKRF